MSNNYIIESHIINNFDTDDHWSFLASCSNLRLAEDYIWNTFGDFIQHSKHEIIIHMSKDRKLWTIKTQDDRYVHYRIRTEKLNDDPINIEDKLPITTDPIKKPNDISIGDKLPINYLNNIPYTISPKYFIDEINHTLSNI